MIIKRRNILVFIMSLFLISCAFLISGCKSTEYDIIWTNAEGITYQAVDSDKLPDKVKEGSTVKFKITVGQNYDSKNMEVKANTTKLEPNTEGIYSFKPEFKTTITVSGVTEKSTLYSINWTNVNGVTYTDELGAAPPRKALKKIPKFLLKS